MYTIYAEEGLARKQGRRRLPDHAFADRLKSAVDGWPEGGVRTLEKKLKAMSPPPPGSSYAMIRRYIASSARPSIEFIRAAAKVLGVRWEWLAADEGEMTNAAEMARQAREGRSAEEPGAAVDQQIRETFKTALPWLELWDEAMNALSDLVWLIANSDAKPQEFMVEITADAIPKGTHETGRPLLDATEGYRRFTVAMAKRLAELVGLTLGTLSLRPGQLQEGAQREMFVVLWCQALKAAWLAATTETKPLGWFQASVQRETGAAREKGADEMLEELQRKFDETTQGKDAVDTSTQGKEKANNGK